MKSLRRIASSQVGRIVAVLCLLAPSLVALAVYTHLGLSDHHQVTPQAEALEASGLPHVHGPHGEHSAAGRHVFAHGPEGQMLAFDPEVDPDRHRHEIQESTAQASMRLPALEAFSSLLEAASTEGPPRPFDLGWPNRFDGHPETAAASGHLILLLCSLLL